MEPCRLRLGKNDMHRLPVLTDHAAALETCGYCPKLCRATCPVSEAEPRDSLTPWGKMTLAWLAARGDVPADRAHADVVWGCSGCYRCSTACEHDNPVVPTLMAARHMVREGDGAPEGVARVMERHPARARRVAERVEQVRAEFDLPEAANSALVIGCGYWLYQPGLARRLTLAVKELVGSFALIHECCGALHDAAGDTAGLSVQRRQVERALTGADRVMVYDPGCAMALRRREHPVTSVVQLVADHLDRLAPLATPPEGRLRFHDPCKLGRGLGIYDEPRRVLERLCGAPPEEFRHRRSDALCSGAGGLLPQSFPQAARLSAETRVEEHSELGGGTIVTACSSSLRHLRRAGADVVDWAVLATRGILAK